MLLQVEGNETFRFPAASMLSAERTGSGGELLSCGLVNEEARTPGLVTTRSRH